MLMHKWLQNLDGTHLVLASGKWQASTTKKDGGLSFNQQTLKVIRSSSTSRKAQMDHLNLKSSVDLVRNSLLLVETLKVVEAEAPKNSEHCRDRSLPAGDVTQKVLAPRGKSK